jgi:small subunit ribosomal protein S8e
LLRYLGISRDSRHKRRATGGRKANLKKKRQYETGRPPANTKLGPSRIHTVRCRGGNLKFRAMRLESGNFSWGSEGLSRNVSYFEILSVCTRKTRVLDVVYNASNNELVRTKTLVKNSIVQVDATPYRAWYEQHYGVKVGLKKAKKAATEEEVLFLLLSRSHQLYAGRQEIQESDREA